MYNVLVVDDDSTCLIILKACLNKWRYEVTTVKHAADALCLLRDKPYDLVLSDVHMPDMNGFELQQLINQEFHLPVILISGDKQLKVMCKGIQNGAQCFLVKPIVADDVKDIWQYSMWWKRTKNSSTSPVREIDTSSRENVAGNIALSSDKTPTVRRRRKFVWTHNLHTRFVEAILVLGYHKAVPKNILEIMNAPQLTREQVASHLQKYRKFLQRVLEGRTDIRNSHWMDFNYYSSSVSGNPHLMLLNQLRDQKRTGKLAGPIGAGNLSSSSYGFRPLPPFTPADASSSRNVNAMSMPNNYASSYANVTAQGLGGSTTFGNSCNANMGNIFGRSTTPNPIQNMNHERNQMGYYNQNTLVPPQNYNYRNEGLVGGANNNMFPTANHMGTSSTAPFRNNFYSNQSFNVGNVQRDPNTGISFGANQSFNIVGGQGSDILFNGNNIGQLGNVQRVPNTGISFGANQFGNTSMMNEQQLGGGQMTDNRSWFNNNGVIPPDNSLVGPNQIQGEDGEDYWGDMMNVGVADDKDEDSDEDEDDENSGDEDFKPEGEF